MRAVTGAIVIVALGVGCGGADARPEYGPPPEGWPSELVVGGGAGPALFLGSRENDPAVGYASPGVKVRLAGPIRGDRVPVVIDGPLKVRAYLTTSRLAARVKRRGRIRGTPVLVVVNDWVGVVGESRPGIARVEARPWIGRLPVASLGPFVGEYPANRLSADEQPAAQMRHGEPHALPPRVEVPVYARPRVGREIARLPALDPPLVVEVIGHRGDWWKIRAGLGPYLQGYVQAPLTPAPAGAGEAAALSMDEGAGEGVPERIAREEQHRLWRVRARSKVRFNGQTVAIFAQGGWAREMNRYPTGEVDVFAAVDNRVAVRGMLRERDLEAAPADALERRPAAPPAPTPPTEPTAPPSEGTPVPEDDTPPPPPPGTAPPP